MSRHCFPALVLASSMVSHAECIVDTDRAVIASALVRVELPKLNEKGDVRIYYRGKLAVARHWYYCVLRSMQAAKSQFRCTGKVVGWECLERGPARVKVRLKRLTDDPDDPDRGVFELTYQIEDGRATVLHEMTFTPRSPMLIQGYEFFMATEQPKPQTHRFHFIQPGWQPGSLPAESRNPYGRLPFPRRHPWLGIEDTTSGRIIALGAPPADVRMLQYAIDFKRLELSRSGGYVTPGEPLRDYALIAFGEDIPGLVAQQRAFEAEVVRPSRHAEPRLPQPKLAQPEPADTFGQRIVEAGQTCHVQAGDFKLTIDRHTGALAQVETARGRLLREPGGVMFVEWPERNRSGPAGKVANLQSNSKALSYDWHAPGLTAKHRIEPGPKRVLWQVEVKNTTAATRLLEVRLSLPCPMDGTKWFYWDGLALRSVGAATKDCETTTLVPGDRYSQGIFPAACLHSERAGLAVGMAPMHIESFYGSRVSPARGHLDTFYYVVRWALASGATRHAQFVLYAIDPQWSWRSCVERYWEFWPEVFEAPSRDDVWGLFAPASPRFVARQGDKFIEICRRMRVGGMELYAPFSKTGDFYPDKDPAYVRPGRRAASLSHEQMRGVFEIANIASCNLSYVIPTKCEREMAKAKFADSIVRVSDGSFFMRDYWDVMGGGREKLAGMYAWGNSFGQSLRGELRQIVKHYQPDGFYLDNGAIVWCDYGRMTEWAAFDDEGRVYNNAGIAYAKLLGDLREFAPHIQRNPGEFIQYFSGFRGQSHLTNCLQTQVHYIRSHRLIMGYKPIYTGHTRHIGSKQDLFDMLQFGGLPWLTGMVRRLEPLAQAWAPIAIALARAGWRPIPHAVAAHPAVRIERFGRGEGTMFTVRNLSEEPVSAKLALAGRFSKLCDFHGRARVCPAVDEQTGLTEVAIDIPADEMIFLQAKPKPRTRTVWPKVKFLAEALPTSIVTRPDATSAERHVARSIKGFIELQGELLKVEAVAVEIIVGNAKVQYPHRVIIRPGPQPDLLAPSDDVLVVEVADEVRTRRLLSGYLDAIAKPFSEQPARWVP